MKANDVLMKKWCFGMGRGKVRAREEAVQVNGELHTYSTYPKYRTIVLKVTSACKKNGQWMVEGVQYSSLNGMPKKVKIKLLEKNGLLYAPNQKKPFLKIKADTMLTEEGMPPVGSLITVNKKHAIVTEVGRNELVVWPGTIKWHSD